MLHGNYMSSFFCPGIQVQQFLRLAQRGTDEKEREKALVSLRRGLQHPDTQQTFIRSVEVVGAFQGKRVEGIDHRLSGVLVSFM